MIIFTHQFMYLLWLPGIKRTSENPRSLFSSFMWSFFTLWSKPGSDVSSGPWWNKGKNLVVSSPLLFFCPHCWWRISPAAWFCHHYALQLLCCSHPRGHLDRPWGRMQVSSVLPDQDMDVPLDPPGRHF